MDDIANCTEGGQIMSRNIELKPRENGNIPPEKLRDILSRIYPEETVEELMDMFVEKPQPPKGE